MCDYLVTQSRGYSCEPRTCGHRGNRHVAGLWLCLVHYEMLERAFEDDILERRRAIAERREAARKEAETERDRLRRVTSIVYYVQGADELIKIGFTENFRNRLPALKKEYGARHGQLTLLGWHRGSREAETAMHRRFADDRVEGEWFLASDELLAHVALIRQRHAVWADDLLHHIPTAPRPSRTRVPVAA